MYSNEMSSEQLGRAIRLASDLHCGQTDKSGEPYILHSIAVMASCAPVHDVMMVAILHDVVEDCDIGITQLKTLRFPDIVCSGVEAITRRVVGANNKLECRTAKKGDKKEIYADFIMRTAQHPISCIVKMKDLEHNLSPERLDNLELDNMKFLVKRYQRAQRELDHHFIGACWEYYGKLI